MLVIGFMINMEDLIKMCVNGSVVDDHYFDESNDPDSDSMGCQDYGHGPVRGGQENLGNDVSDLPPIHYGLELIREPNGKVDWVED